MNRLTAYRRGFFVAILYLNLISGAVLLNNGTSQCFNVLKYCFVYILSAFSFDWVLAVGLTMRSR